MNAKQRKQRLVRLKAESKKRKAKGKLLTVNLPPHAGKSLCGVINEKAKTSHLVRPIEPLRDVMGGVRNLIGTDKLFTEESAGLRFVLNEWMHESLTQATNRINRENKQ